MLIMPSFKVHIEAADRAELSGTQIGLFASSLKQLLQKVQNLHVQSPCYVYLEDGTLVIDEDYFSELSPHTKLWIRQGFVGQKRTINEVSPPNKRLAGPNSMMHYPHTVYNVAGTGPSSASVHQYYQQLHMANEQLRLNMHARVPTPPALAPPPPHYQNYLVAQRPTILPGPRPVIGQVISTVPNNHPVRSHMQHVIRTPLSCPVPRAPHSSTISQVPVPALLSSTISSTNEAEASMPCESRPPCRYASSRSPQQLQSRTISSSVEQPHRNTAAPVRPRPPNLNPITQPCPSGTRQECIDEGYSSPNTPASLSPVELQQVQNSSGKPTSCTIIDLLDQPIHDILRQDLSKLTTPTVPVDGLVKSAAKDDMSGPAAEGKESESAAEDDKSELVVDDEPGSPLPLVIDVYRTAAEDPVDEEPGSPLPLVIDVCGPVDDPVSCLTPQGVDGCMPAAPAVSAAQPIITKDDQIIEPLVVTFPIFVENGKICCTKSPVKEMLESDLKTDAELFPCKHEPEPPINKSIPDVSDSECSDSEQPASPIIKPLPEILIITDSESSDSEEFYCKQETKSPLKNSVPEVIIISDSESCESVELYCKEEFEHSSPSPLPIKQDPVCAEQTSVEKHGCPMPIKLEPICMVLAAPDKYGSEAIRKLEPICVEPAVVIEEFGCEVFVSTSEHTCTLEQLNTVVSSLQRLSTTLEPAQSSIISESVLVDSSTMQDSDMCDIDIERLVSSEKFLLDDPYPCQENIIQDYPVAEEDSEVLPGLLCPCDTRPMQADTHEKSNGPSVTLQPTCETQHTTADPSSLRPHPVDKTIDMILDNADSLTTQDHILTKSFLSGAPTDPRLKVKTIPIKKTDNQILALKLNFETYEWQAVVINL